MADRAQKEHEPGLKVVCQYLEKDGATVPGVQLKRKGTVVTVSG